MALSPGTRIGSYEIAEQIGVGGMGEVYRATDTKLARQVAIKVLPEAVASDAERLARFDREARTLASLNHPHIAAIYGLEDADGSKALVMELVEGPTLADRIARGPVHADEALSIARQIAEALEAAHERGIVHRDLKPANIKVGDDGTVKVLDFGLAKAIEPPSAMSPGLSQSPTITTPAMTQAGIILGTAAYMSPEQAKGRPADKRSDVWAFGCVLYEMLTGRRVFGGEDVADTLAAVLRADVDWGALPGQVSPALRTFLVRCLQRDPRQRIRDIGDMRLALEGAFDHATPASEAAPPAWGAPRVLAFSGVLAVVAMAVGIFTGRAWFSPGAGQEEATYLSVPLEAGQRLFPDEPSNPRGNLPTLALSPDGEQLVYVATDGTTTRLFDRPLSRARAVPLADTEGATGVWFSPDGRSVAFTSNGPGRRVDLETGEVRVIGGGGGRLSPGGGLSWADDDTFVGSTGPTVVSVRSDSGSPTVLAEVSADSTGRSVGSGDFLHPSVLPGGRTLLFNVRPRGDPSWTASGMDIVVQSLDTGERKLVVAGGSDPRYVPSGHLVFMRRGALMAVPFDLDRLEATADPVVVVEGVMQAEGPVESRLVNGLGQFSISRSGTLAYVPGGGGAVARRELVWVDRSGQAEAVASLPAADLMSPRLSPDGTRVLISRDGDVWVYDFDGRGTRLTADRPTTPYLAWDPDGTRVAYSAVRAGADRDVWTSPVDGSREPELLADGTGHLDVESWSPDGRILAVHQHGPQAEDMMTIAIEDGPPEVRPFLADRFSTSAATFSPDGRYVAYSSTESGPREVYIRPFPGPGGRVPVSVGGGVEPVWTRNGELFYRNLDRSSWMVVTVDTTPALRLSAPRELFSGTYFTNAAPVPQYDVTADGQRLLMIRSVEVASEPETEHQGIVMVQHFFDVLRRLAPTD